MQETDASGQYYRHMIGEGMVACLLNIHRSLYFGSFHAFVHGRPCSFNLSES